MEDRDFVSCEDIRRLFHLDPLTTRIYDLRSIRWGFLTEQGRWYLQYERDPVEHRWTMATFTTSDSSHPPLVVVIDKGLRTSTAYVFTAENLTPIRDF